jgi:hypothetical protein
LKNGGLYRQIYELQLRDQEELHDEQMLAAQAAPVILPTSTTDKEME